MLSISCGSLPKITIFLLLTMPPLLGNGEGMRKPTLLCFLILSCAAVFTSCQTNSNPGEVSYREPVSPIDGAVMMQDRIGQINRSFIR